MQPKPGMTMLGFLGRGTNSRPFYGMSGRRYLFGGRHHTLEYVLTSDVDYMLEMREGGKPLFEVIKLSQPAKVEIPEPVTPVELVAAMEVPEVTEPVKVKKPRSKKVVVTPEPVKVKKTRAKKAK